MALLLLTESKARTAELDTTSTDDVVHLYCAAGLEAAEQLTYNGAVSFTVIVFVVLNAGSSISERKN